MTVLLVVNGPAYGSELPFNGLRLAHVGEARRGGCPGVLDGGCGGFGVGWQQLPDGYYHLDRMISSVLRRGGEVGCCGTCMDARAVEEKQLVEVRDGRAWRSWQTGRWRPTGS